MRKLYYGGDIVTMEREGETVEAVLTQDGIIVRTGALSDLEREAPDSRRIDLQGSTMLPAFIDPHGHITVVARLSGMADLSGCQDFSDIVRVMKEYIAEKNIPQGQMVMGFGYDHTILKEQAHPDKRVLDEISSANPIYISHTSGHMGCANSRMLELAEIDSKTPDVPGGLIGRMEGGSEPSGYLEEGAMLPVQQRIAGEGNERDMVSALSKCQDYYLKNGITTVQDGASSSEMVSALHQAAEQGGLVLDVVAYPMMMEQEVEKLWEKYPQYAGKYTNHLKLGGYKMILDGSPQGRSAWMTRPYEGEETYRGYPWMQDEEVERLVRKAIDDNRQLLVHCNGDAAADQYLNAYEKALGNSANPQKRSLRPVMIHCQTVRDDQLDRMKALNMIPSIFIAHTYYWGDVHLKNLGPERGSRISPARAAFDRGLKANFHQDPPVVKPLMLQTVWSAVNRITRSGKVIGADQRVSVYEALQAVTVNAAYAYYEEDVKGSIHSGKKADFVLLDNNPLKVEPGKIRDIKVLSTIKSDQAVYKAGT